MKHLMIFIAVLALAAPAAAGTFPGGLITSYDNGRSDNGTGNGAESPIGVHLSGTGSESWNDRDPTAQSSLRANRNSKSTSAKSPASGEIVGD